MKMSCFVSAASVYISITKILKINQEILSALNECFNAK